MHKHANTIQLFVLFITQFVIGDSIATMKYAVIYQHVCEIIGSNDLLITAPTTRSLSIKRNTNVITVVQKITLSHILNKFSILIFLQYPTYPDINPKIFIEHIEKLGETKQHHATKYRLQRLIPPPHQQYGPLLQEASQKLVIDRFHILLSFISPIYLLTLDISFQAFLLQWKYHIHTQQYFAVRLSIRFHDQISALLSV